MTRKPCGQDGLRLVVVLGALLADACGGRSDLSSTQAAREVGFVDGGIAQDATRGTTIDAGPIETAFPGQYTCVTSFTTADAHNGAAAGGGSIGTPGRLTIEDDGEFLQAIIMDDSLLVGSVSFLATSTQSADPVTSATDLSIHAGCEADPPIVDSDAMDFVPVDGPFTVATGTLTIAGSSVFLTLIGPDASPACRGTTTITLDCTRQ